MLGLVDYGSDSDSEDTPQTHSKPQPTPTPSSSLILPAPKSSSLLSLPPPSSTSSPATVASTSKGPAAPPKKAKGPVRIVLDDLPSSTPGSANDGPPSKKLKFTPTASGSKGLSGLAAMLPAPKNESVQVKLDKALGSASGSGSGTGPGVGAFLPNSLGKKKATVGKAAAVPMNVQGPVIAAVGGEGEDGEEEEEVPAAPQEDFFGLGSVTATTSSSSFASTSRSSAPHIKSSAPSLSSAPSIPKPSTFGDAPTPSDPYPGFTQLPSGDWVAKDAKTYKLWMEAMKNGGVGRGGMGGEKGFEESEMARLGVEEFDAGKVREAWENRPGLVDGKRPGREEEEKKEAVVKAAKLGGGRARGKHQLSTLLNEAVERRQELEDRIAQGRANRKSAGNKYGF